MRAVEAKTKQRKKFSLSNKSSKKKLLDFYQLNVSVALWTLCIYGTHNISSFRKRRKYLAQVQVRGLCCCGGPVYIYRHTKPCRQQFITCPDIFNTRSCLHNLKYLRLIPQFSETLGSYAFTNRFANLLTQSCWKITTNTCQKQGTDYI